MLIRSNPETSVGILVPVMALLGACSPATHPRAAKTASRLSGRDLISFENRQPQSRIDFVLNNGTTEAKHMIDSTLGGVACFDLDSDGFLDIFFTNGARIPSLTKGNESFQNRLYRNNHDGTFTDVTERAGVTGDGYSMGVATGDFDNDGWVDL